MTQPPEAGDLREAVARLVDPYFDQPGVRFPNGRRIGAFAKADAILALVDSPAPSQGDVELREALEPFATFAQRNVDDDGWNDFGISTSRERILDWFGPSDFRRARDAARAIAAMPVSAGLDPDGYLWKWVERGLFDPQISAKEALSVIANHPVAPWKSGRWDVDHKTYAKQFYERFPKAALSDDDGKEGR